MGGVGVGAGEFAHATGSNWKGANGKWYSKGWGGNQYVGSRALAIETAEHFNQFGRGVFWVDALLEGKEIFVDISNYEYMKTIKPTIDVTMGVIGAYGGPWGFSAYALYTAVDLSVKYTVGWERVGEGVSDAMRDISEVEEINRRVLGRNVWGGPSI